MSLQLKGGNVVETNTDSNENGGENRRGTDAKNADPWGNKDIEDNFYKVNVKAMKEEAGKEYGRSLKKVLRYTFIIIFVVLIGVGGVLGRKYFLKQSAEKGRDLAYLIGYDESSIEEELGITFTDSNDLINDTLSWRSDKKLEVHSNDDAAIIYLDGRQTGINVHSEQYKLYNIQVGMSEDEALEATTYPYSNKNFYINGKDDDEGKTTTVYYFNKGQNDCIGLTVNDMTNTVQGITYIDNYQVFVFGHENN